MTWQVLAYMTWLGLNVDLGVFKPKHGFINRNFTISSENKNEKIKVKHK